MTTIKREPALSKGIPHIRQRYSWDCGITCVLMTLCEGDRKKFLQDFFEICKEEGFGHTTCTIDLCYLLKRFNIDHTMYTTRQSPNIRSLINSSENLNKVSDRIKQRFTNAKSNGIKVCSGVLSIGDIIAHVENRGPAIVLVDAGLLSCDLCKHNKLQSEIRRVFSGPYRGHYIVVVGRARHRLVYRDPARAPPACAAAPARLHAARLARGTDCDVILVYR